MSNACFVRSGNHYSVSRKTPATAIDRLPGGVYSPVVDDKGNVFLEITAPNYRLPKQLFGDIIPNAKTIFKTFTKIRKGLPTGVLLHGKKGTGKSQLAELISNMAIESDMPVIYLDKKLPGHIISLLVTMCSPCVLYIDEIDRVYRDQYRDSDADTLVSVVGSSACNDVLTIITTNKINSLPDAFINRPTRFMFNIEYKYMKDDVVRELVKSSGLGDDVIAYVSSFRRNLTFDVLNTVINLVKEYGSLKKFLTMEHIYNLPSKDEVAVQVVAVKYKDEAPLGDRDVRTTENGIIVNRRDPKDGYVEEFVDLKEFLQQDLKDGLISYKTPNGDYRVIMRIAEEHQYRRRQIDYSHSPSISDDFEKYFDLKTYTDNDKVVDITKKIADKAAKIALESVDKHIAEMSEPEPEPTTLVSRTGLKVTKL